MNEYDRLMEWDKDDLVNHILDYQPILDKPLLIHALEGLLEEINDCTPLFDEHERILKEKKRRILEQINELK